MFGKLMRGAVSVARSATKNPLLKMVPGVGNVLAGASLGLGALSMIQGSGGGGGGGGMPPLPTMGQPGLAGKTGIFRNDPNSTAAVEAVAIAKGDLVVSYRRPRGKMYRDYVVVRDNNGDPMAVPKDVARKHFGWKPAKKPPISVGQMSALRKANSVVKTLKRVNKMAMQVANFGHRPRPQMIDMSKPKMIPIKGRRVA